MDDYDFKNKEIFAQIKNLENTTKDSSNNLKQLYESFTDKNQKFLNDITGISKQLMNKIFFQTTIH